MLRNLGLREFDTFGAARRRQDFGFIEGDWAGVVDPGADQATSAVATSISDHLRSGADAGEVPWGAGAQDYIAAIEYTDPGTQPVPAGLFDAGSLSDRLRTIAAAQAEGATRDEAISGTPGGQLYDPTLRTGTLDWSDVFRYAPQAINTLAGVVTTVGRTVSSLAGVRPHTTVPGNPAPGGSPSPSLLQRVLGGAPAGRITQPAGGGGGLLSGGNLLVVGLLAAIGWAIVRKA